MLRPDGIRVQGDAGIGMPTVPSGLMLPLLIGKAGVVIPWRAAPPLRVPSPGLVRPDGSQRASPGLVRPGGVQRPEMATARAVNATMEIEPEQ